MLPSRSFMETPAAELSVATKDPLLRPRAPVDAEESKHQEPLSFQPDQILNNVSRVSLLKEDEI